MIQSIKIKIDYHTHNNLSELNKLDLSKPVKLIIMDHNIIGSLKNLNESHLESLTSKNFVKAKKILLHQRQANINHNLLKQFGFQHYLTKPFLANELIELINKYLGVKA
ncbi:hypothetical protein BVY03_05405 [bacterium K02(2017)]|nr:hypothetical protein BVY03_05405 [bacterium K02(2017)]